MTHQSPKPEGISALSREERWELARALFERADAPCDARAAFRRKYPTAPKEMIDTAAFHVYVDGPEAVLDWLADAELFLRDPDHKLCCGVTWHLLYHVYNWHQFEALLPDGTSGVLGLLADLKQFAEDGELEGVQQTVKELERMFDGNVDCPDFG